MADYFNSKHGPTMPIHFYKANVTVSASDEDCLLAGDGVGTLWIAPVAGSVVGISARASGTFTAGSITVRAHAAGTEIATTGYPAPVLSSAAQGSYATVRPGAIRFAAGDTLGVSVSSTTTLDPTNTEDVSAWLYVQLDPD